MMNVLNGLVEDFAKAVASNEEYCEKIMRGELNESDYIYSPELERTLTKEELVFYRLGFKAATEAAYRTIRELVDPDLAHKEAKMINDFWRQREGEEVRMTNTNIDMAVLRRVRLEHTPQGPQFHSNDLEPLREGEWVKYDPKDKGWYGQPYCEERAVVGRVGKILSVGRPFEALGEGETYEEQCKNRRMVRHSYGAVAYAASYVCPRLVVVEGGPSDWLPGLEELKGTEGMQNE